jgi:hypothetical protein
MALSLNLITYYSISFHNIDRLGFLIEIQCDTYEYKRNVKIILNTGCFKIIKSRRMRWVGHVARMGEKKNVYRSLVGTSKGQRPLGRLRCRWGDNIKVDLLEIGWGGADWIGLVQDRDKWRALVNAVMNLRIP